LAPYCTKWNTNAIICDINVAIFNSYPHLERFKTKKEKNIMNNPVNSNSQNKDNKAKCPDCDSELNVPCDLEKGEVLSCPGCGLELEAKEIAIGGGCVDLQELTIEGEDWGE
jgi:hypothetical protein